MPSTPLRSAVLLGLLLATSGAASASFRGYVEQPYTPTTCLQESHFLTDPCTDSLTLLEDDRAILDLYLCKHVIVDGPDVGIECQVIAPASVQRVQPACPIPFAGLWLSGESPAQVNWLRVTCAVSHDVVRGDLKSLAAGNLGAVTCLANDVPQADFWYVAGPADAESPAPGEAFFYLARSAGLPDGDTTYGHSSDGREETPLSGDCPL